MLLKKHKYPPEGMDDAVATVMLQCDLWADNNDMEHRVVNYSEVLKESNNQVSFYLLSYIFPLHSLSAKWRIDLHERLNIIRECTSIR